MFDWLLRNDDRRVGKNPAGYLVASIRSDYQVPGDYQAGGFEGQSHRQGGIGTRARTHDPRRSRHVHDGRPMKRFRPSATRFGRPRLRAAWDRLPESGARGRSWLSVKAENPGLGRWKNMLEPLLPL